MSGGDELSRRRPQPLLPHRDPRHASQGRRPLRHPGDGRRRWPHLCRHTGARAGPLGPGFYDLDVRRQFLARQGITTQVLCAPPVVFHYWLQGEAALDIIQVENDAIAAAVASDPDHFVGFATVPLQAPALAIRDCEPIVHAGLRGVEVGSNVDGVDLADARFRPF